MSETSSQSLRAAVTFGMVPTQDSTELRLLLNRFCDTLGRLSDRTVLPHRAPSPRALASAVHAGRVQLAWASPTQLVLSDLLTDCSPLVSSERQGVAKYHSVLFVRADSPIYDVKKLGGARIAWVAPTSAGGYLLPRISLARKGIDLTRTFLREVFVNSHPAVARAVFDGEADVGATHAVYEGADSRRALLHAGFMDTPRPAGQRAPRVIDTSGPVPSDVIVAAKDTSVSTRNALTRALLRLHDEPGAAEIVHALFRADRFVPFTNESRTELEQIVESARTLRVVATPA